MEDNKLAPETKPADSKSSFSRRDFVSAALGASLMTMVPPGVRSGAWAAGSDAPEKKEVRIGFIPLTDCASVVMASVMKFDEKYGIKIIPTKEASWASVRDKLVNGELDAAHVLYGLIYGVQLGIGGPKKDMSVLMNLNNNGQAITLSNQLQRQGRDRRPEPGCTDRQEGKGIHLRPDLPDRHPRHVAVLLAGGARHQPAQGRQDDHRAAAADGRQHARRQHGRLLRRRAVEQPRDHGQHRLHRRDHAGHLGRPSGKGARHHRRMGAEEPEHGARHGRRHPRRRQVDRRLDRQQAEDGRNHRPEVLRQYRHRSHRRPHARPLPERPRQELGRQEPHEVLQRRHGEFPLPQRRHVVHDPAQALGAAQEPSGLSGGRQAGQSHRHLQAGCGRCRRRAAQERHAQPAS